MVTRLSTPYGGINAAYRFWYIQGGKLRPCGYLRRNLVSLHTAILSPITLPTWEHIYEISKAAYPINRDWAFIKGIHSCDYRQLPLYPAHVNLSVAALRHLVTGKWMAFAP